MARRRPRPKVDGILYARVDTGLISHPKMLRACAEDPACFELYVRALLWSKQADTDGEIPFGALGLIGFSGDETLAADVLVRERLWIAFDDGYGINDYDRYQVTKRDREQQSVSAKKAANARWKRDRGTMRDAMRPASDAHRTRNAETMPKTETETETKKEPKTVVEPSSTWPTIWSAYSELHPTAKPTPKRRRLLAARASEGFTDDVLLAALRGNHADPWCNGDNPDGKPYHAFELIFRDAAHVERYAELAPGSTNGHVAGESRLERARRLTREAGGASD